VASLAFDAETSARFDDDQQDFGGQALQFRIRLSSGDHDLAAAIPRIYEGLPARYGGPNPSSRDVPRKPFNPPASASAERIAQMRKAYDERQAELQKIPYVVVWGDRETHEAMAVRKRAGEGVMSMSLDALLAEIAEANPSGS